MRIFRLAVIATALMGVMMLSGCSGESWSWHQKLTVEIETPQGLVSGSAVTKVSWGEVDSFSHNYPASYHGEASVVDLGNGRYLFALIGEGTKYLAFRTFNGGPGIGEKIFADMARSLGSAPVSRQHYPMLVTFTDINDPKTVKRVDPNNLDASFGCENSVSRAIPAEPGILNNPPSGSSNPSPEPPSSSSPPSGPPSVAGQASSGSASPRTGGGADAPAKNQKCYKLKSITLEITNEPVTKGVVEGVLGWINDKTTLKLIWSNLSDEQHGLLSRGNWQRGS